MPLDDSPPRLDIQDSPEGPLVRLQGSWTAAQLTLAPAWAALGEQLDSLSSARPPAASNSARWSLEDIEQLDYLGAQVLWTAWRQRWPDDVQLAPEQREMLETVEKFTVALAPPRRSPWSEPLVVFGERLLGLIDHLKGMLRLLGQLLLDLLRLFRHPRQGPWRDLSGHLYHFGATALPITALVGFLIGVVLAYLISQQLRQFGADAFIVNILGISLIRELGPVLAAILIAGRSGSAITAQIGVMRVTEEIDAMRVMGIARGFRLVMPRAIALAVVMPLISVWTTIAALLGGMLAADVSMGVTPSYFLNSLPAAVSVSNLTLATSKSVVFGLLIALVGCHYGLRVKPNTESLGKGTTASVVTSITVVILVDALFAILFRSVGI
ncbi:MULTISPECIES: ABC transporter permease [unclassified Polaromonas]|uniref:MlaE family ABC transporter permease n=1 Tax=unclassified Polaromonas TaxID=2638319 RepID=UPI0018CA40FA|nr:MULTISPECIES: ABC transporter permease [unclassified Polaromonas]MBG6073301.1 phospholipid/cholesterol/gamma-HCH transport system permease protein [Polaromonas sp. CG_9.7]MBG6115359.1 phospholipid/cholesterol/gamma-HCH transport system permease protein [Polaromonas sp. CG_9.2]MDH6182936.1 phospholipid/cholesterol/gamma-HCH transport system permease protein [Polaromonas sp. CG_23.6]